MVKIGVLSCQRYQVPGYFLESSFFCFFGTGLMTFLPLVYTIQNPINVSSPSRVYCSCCTCTNSVCSSIHSIVTITCLLGVLIMPLAGWIWSVNVEVAQLRNDMGDIERKVAELEIQLDKQEESTRTLIGVERDVQHIRDILNRIESLVTG